MFSLIVELYPYDLTKIDMSKFIEYLHNLDQMYKKYSLPNADIGEIPPELIQYFEHVRDSGNELKARKYRGELLEGYIKESINQ